MEPGIKTVAKRGKFIELNEKQATRARRRHIHPRSKRQYYIYSPPGGPIEDWSHKLRGGVVTESSSEVYEQLKPMLKEPT